MAESMSHVERVLWRIAELGARCSQQSAAGERGPLWEELEQTIAGLEAEFEAARQATDCAPAQVRSLEGRLKVALSERDREKARVKESYADAEAARRERDRAVQKARKAMAAAVEARNAAAAAKATALRAVVRAEAAEAALDQAMAVRDRAVASLDEAIATGERAADARDAAVRDRDEATRERDAAVRELAAVLKALEGAQARITELETAVVVLPGVTLPEPQTPGAPAPRVSWQPTWSEWANPAAQVDLESDDMAETIDVTEGDVRYLNVAATIGGLLPEDLGQFLLAGTTVVRREGRLYAVLAVNSAEQAERFAEAGFKVEWTSNAPLGV